MNKNNTGEEMTNFYYDEAYHDLSITQKDGVQNIDRNDDSLYFVVAIIGISEEDTANFFKDFIKIEDYFKNKIGIKITDEFKGSSMKIKNYEYGLSTMKPDFLNFYTKLFDLLNSKSAIVQISAICKFEYVIHEIFNGIYDKLSIPESQIKSFLYSFVKFLNQHKTERLIILFHSDNLNSEDIFSEIKSIIEEVINSRHESELKASEVEFAILLHNVLIKQKGNLNVKQKFEWNYSFSLEGLLSLIRELNINNNKFHLYLDGKGHRTQKLFESAKQMFPNISIERCESKDNAGIRISDFLSNLIGRLIKMVDFESTKKLKKFEEEGRYNELVLLDDKWFDLNKDVFICYKALGKFFHNKSNIKWTTKVGIYADEVVVVFTLFEYIYESKSYNKFKALSPHEHAVKLNNKVVSRLKNIYD
jgi:hypothetical protein